MKLAFEKILERHAVPDLRTSFRE